MSRHTQKEIAMMAFASRLHARLDELNYPSAEKRGRYTAVGRDFGVSYQAAKKWLDGITLPELARCLEIADRYGLGFEYLMTGRGPRLASDAAAQAPEGAQHPLLTLWDRLSPDVQAALETQMRAMVAKREPGR